MLSCWVSLLSLDTCSPLSSVSRTEVNKMMDLETSFHFNTKSLASFHPPDRTSGLDPLQYCDATTKSVSNLFTPYWCFSGLQLRSGCAPAVQPVQTRPFSSGNIFTAPVIASICSHTAATLVVSLRLSEFKPKRVASDAHVRLRVCVSIWTRAHVKHAWLCFHEQRGNEDLRKALKREREGLDQSRMLLQLEHHHHPPSNHLLLLLLHY